MDIECVGSLDASLAGHSLVLQSETARRVNNAQVPHCSAWRGHLNDRGAAGGAVTLGTKWRALAAPPAAA